MTRSGQRGEAAPLLGAEAQPAIFPHEGGSGAEHGAIRQAEAARAVEQSPALVPPAEHLQLIQKLAIAAAGFPSGLAWQTRSNCSGVNLRSHGSRRAAGSRPGAGR
ncbi:MAG: hypothetical protein VKN56_12230 [Cyanobacteriota bacterium]|nr:hypothetical protein [Cyanobacteriota bacterium]